MPRNGLEKPVKRGRLAPFAIANITAAVAYQGVIATVKHARSQEWLADLPNWVNPIEHVNNIAIEVLPQVLAWTAIGLAIKVGNIKERTAKRMAAATLFAGIAYQGIGEMEATQDLVMASGIFSSTSPDAMDFLYGVTAVVGFDAISRRMIRGHYDAAVRDFYGPSSIELIQHPRQFTTLPVGFSSPYTIQ
jgi:hypothetical protein